MKRPIFAHYHLITLPLFMVIVTGCYSDRRSNEEPIEFIPNRITAQGKLNIWLITNDKVVYISAPLDELPTEKSLVHVSGKLISGADADKVSWTGPVPPHPDWQRKEERLVNGIVYFSPLDPEAIRLNEDELPEVVCFVQQLSFESVTYTITDPFLVKWGSLPSP